MLGCTKNAAKELVNANLHHGMKLEQRAKSSLTGDYIRPMVEFQGAAPSKIRPFGKFELQYAKVEQTSERENALKEVQKLAVEKAKLQYRITHLCRALKDVTRQQGDLQPQLAGSGSERGHKENQQQDDVPILPPLKGRLWVTDGDTSEDNQAVLQTCEPLGMEHPVQTETPVARVYFAMAFILSITALAFLMLREAGNHGKCPAYVEEEEEMDEVPPLRSSSSQPSKPSKRKVGASKGSGSSSAAYVEQFLNPAVAIGRLSEFSTSPVVDPAGVRSSLLSPAKLSSMEDDMEEVKTFESLGLCEQLVEACDSLGWKNPSKIQVEAIPHALQGKDLIGLAQTGSGKTGAFALPILQALLESPQAFFACVLSPTRELAIQIAEQFEALGSAIGVKCAVVVGGVDMMQQTIALAKRPHIVVGTPGRLVDHLSNTKGFSLRTLKYLVLDEADRLLNEDFEKALDEILKAIPRERKTYLFSATMTKKVRKLQRACLRNPVKIEAASKYSTVDTLKQQYRFVPAKYKDCYLIYILSEMSGSTSMVFTRTCESTRLLALVLRNLGLRAIPISGQMSQSKRLGALNKFKAGECNILICTDVASRGLDIPSVDMVINYDIPSNSKDYIHRVGRTARAGRSGVAISLVNQYELEWYIQIEKLIGKKLHEFPAQEEEVLLLLERVSEAKRISQMKMKESGRKRRRGGDDDDDEEEVDRYVTAKNRKSAKNGKSTKKWKNG
ncbi:hypothetical protein HHK36_003825 [Tetracentron sinense]|uniref:DEAD-box ATP-dependent RNA helicase 10 n=1 Tax=Tetracentron sinense TaxID=13715 RepID=A0A834ZU36_TETSI|nr:hypothetical protein HHK36_003825 [Tetracentron sinense]